MSLELFEIRRGLAFLAWLLVILYLDLLFYRLPSSTCLQQITLVIWMQRACKIAGSEPWITALSIPWRVLTFVFLHLLAFPQFQVALL